MQSGTYNRQSSKPVEASDASLTTTKGKFLPHRIFPFPATSSTGLACMGALSARQRSSKRAGLA